MTLTSFGQSPSDGAEPPGRNDRHQASRASCWSVARLRMLEGRRLAALEGDMSEDSVAFEEMRLLALTQR